jgi:hypothetical protein
MIAWTFMAIVSRLSTNEVNYATCTDANTWSDMVALPDLGR